LYSKNNKTIKLFSPFKLIKKKINKIIKMRLKYLWINIKNDLRMVNKKIKIIIKIESEIKRKLIFLDRIIISFKLIFSKKKIKCALFLIFFYSCNNLNT
jgi:hypothetical protein